MDRKEAIEVLKKYKYAQEVQEALEYLHPELKESEDERIRKGLIDYFNGFTLPTFGGLNPKKIIAWLEKQGEQVDANKEYWRGYREGRQEILDKYAALEKQGEQNPAWSEEDKEMLRRCISATFDHGYLKECDWLKFF